MQGFAEIFRMRPPDSKTGFFRGSGKSAVEKKEFGGMFIE